MAETPQLVLVGGQRGFIQPILVRVKPLEANPDRHRSAFDDRPDRFIDQSLKFRSDFTMHGRLQKPVVDRPNFNRKGGLFIPGCPVAMSGHAQQHVRSLQQYRNRKSGLKGGTEVQVWLIAGVWSSGPCRLALIGRRGAAAVAFVSATESNQGEWCGSIPEKPCQNAPMSEPLDDFKATANGKSTLPAGDLVGMRAAAPGSISCSKLPVVGDCRNVLRGLRSGIHRRPPIWTNGIP